MSKQNQTSRADELIDELLLVHLHLVVGLLLALRYI